MHVVQTPPSFSHLDIALLLAGLAILAATAVLVAYLIVRQLHRLEMATVGGQFRAFFGKTFNRLETHAKDFPGYDLASLHRALASFRQDCCSEFREVGGVVGYHAQSMRSLLEYMNTPAAGRNLAPTSPIYQRVPTDVDREESLATNSLYFCSMGHDGTSEKLAILLSATTTGQEVWNGMDTQTVQHQVLRVSIACWSKEVADQFFHELEDRRRRLSVYRGKVIEPVLFSGGIHAIGFRNIQKVAEEDLVLPETVKTLIHSSIIGFYEHREILEKAGIEMKRGILFHGPPGTGKTSISLYLAKKLSAFTICFVSGDRLLYPREICRMARYLQPAMVVFEDIDLVAQDRNASGLATVLGELMNQIDGCEPHEQVLFIMNTNSLERLELAVRNRPGRVDQIIAVPLPDREDRRRLIEHFARTLTLNVEDMERVLHAADGATPAMLKEIVKRAAVNSIDGCDGEAGITIRDNDLLLATEQVRQLRARESTPGTLGFGRS